MLSGVLITGFILLCGCLVVAIFGSNGFFRRNYGFEVDTIMFRSTIAMTIVSLFLVVIGAILTLA